MTNSVASVKSKLNDVMFGRIDDDRLVFDLRTVPPEQDAALAALLAQI